MNPHKLYEDSDYLIINKPSGLIVHADGKTDEPTVVDWLLKNYPQINGVGEPGITTTGEKINRSGIVHRIDRDTSGALVIVKNQKSFLFLKDKFQTRAVQKTYRAFVYGIMKMENGVIDRDIGRSKNDFRKWTAQRGATGEMRNAVTEYTVLKAGPSSITDMHSAGQLDKGFSYVEARPLTGRTHQVRVHLKAINHPIVCDRLYAPNKECGENSFLGLNRLALHAYSIVFTNEKGKKVHATAPLPEEFEKALKKLGKS